MLSQLASAARTAKGPGWLLEGVNCKLTGNLCNETVRKYTPPDCEKAEIELTVATISNYNQGCLLLFLDWGFAVTAPHGDANRITADSSGALHINLLEKKKKPASCTSSPLCPLHAARVINQRPRSLMRRCRSRLKSNVCWLWATRQHAARPRNTSSSGARLTPSSAKSIGRLVRLTSVKRTKAPLMPIRSSPLLKRGGGDCTPRLCPSCNSQTPAPARGKQDLLLPSRAPPLNEGKPLHSAANAKRWASWLPVQFPRAGWGKVSPKWPKMAFTQCSKLDKSVSLLEVKRSDSR